MNKISKLLTKASQFAKLAEKSEADLLNSFAQTQIIENEKHLFSDPAYLFSAVKNMKQAFLNAILNVRSLNDQIRERSYDAGTEEYDFVNKYGRTFIKACYDSFPDLDNQQQQDPRKINLLNVENAIRSLKIVVSKAASIPEGKMFVNGLNLQLASAQKGYGVLVEFQKHRPSVSQFDISPAEQMMSGVKSLKPDWMNDEPKNQELNLDQFTNQKPQVGPGQLKLDPNKTNYIQRKPNS